MNAYMTNGTFEFLKKLPKQHPDISFYFMKESASTLVYYEGKGKNVFASGRAYDIVIDNGDLQVNGFVVMNNIPVADEGKATFEDKFKQRQQDVETMPGFQAFRLLRPKNGNTYVVLTQWASENDFENWKNSNQFKQAHKGGDAKPPAYFLDRPFITSYHMVEVE
ncbi:antibiotic biosynthesis monooxygenase family protein [Lentibacillus cibarius]|uniref:Antibiotic biosynthesis monooxygenase n=1 Tax=Lentibacillus cibarius TaxID=2583219 RepID=A0A5S3QPD5_9BACI|nr:antibiotic biosynthesis monooxygenase [Lentibacillus cibarius]TMN23041.1 antibiotic biosynthesis monooxygenase [Lentibacillus cibarius]